MNIVVEPPYARHYEDLDPVTKVRIANAVDGKLRTWTGRGGTRRVVPPGPSMPTLHEVYVGDFRIIFCRHGDNLHLLDVAKKGQGGRQDRALRASGNFCKDNH